MSHRAYLCRQPTIPANVHNANDAMLKWTLRITLIDVGYSIDIQNKNFTPVQKFQTENQSPDTAETISASGERAT